MESKLDKIDQYSRYPFEDHLTGEELLAIFAQCESALCTTNGDTGTVTITARQALLLLRRQFKFSDED